MNIPIDLYPFGLFKSAFSPLPKGSKGNREERFPEDQEIWRLYKKHKGSWGSQVEETVGR